jgi:putative transposase
VIYLWRTVYHGGGIFESFVTRKRYKSAALTLLGTALKRQGKVEKIVIDGLRSYRAAMKDLRNQDRSAVGR